MSLHALDDHACYWDDDALVDQFWLQPNLERHFGPCEAGASSSFSILDSVNSWLEMGKAFGHSTQGPGSIAMGEYHEPLLSLSLAYPHFMRVSSDLDLEKVKTATG